MALISRVNLRRVAATIGIVWAGLLGAQTPADDDDDFNIGAIIQAITPVCSTLTATPQSPFAQTLVTLTATCSNTPTSYEWWQGSQLLATTTANSYTFTTPATAGAYSYAVVARRGGIASASLATNVSVKAANDATYVGKYLLSLTMSAGQDQYASVTFKNTGNTSWSTAAGYTLMPEANTTWTRFSGMTMQVPSGTTSIPPGGTVAFGFTIYAPTSDGTYNFQWRVAKDGVPFGQVSENALIVISGNGTGGGGTGGGTPGVTLGSPASGSVAPSSTIQLSATPAGNIGTVASIKFYANSSEIAVGTNSGGTWSASWNVGSTATTYNITAKAFNSAGNVLSESAPAVVTVGTTRPVPPPPTDNGPAGKLGGALSVSPLGSANYSIPIQLPPATAGMAPAVSLNYDSGGGNGILGVGWSLGGMSAVSRCPRTIVQDGIRGGIDLSAKDKFCLDGQRLVLSTGVYGAANSEYRTEIESFSKVTANGQLGAGPQSFTVKMKDGMTYEYGSNANSRIIMSGHSAPTAWLLNKVIDTKQNYYTVTYTNDTATNQFYASRIDYTGNDSVTPALATYNSVQLVYDSTRTDVSVGYNNGAKVTSNARLTNVKTYAGTTLVRDYKIGYDYSGPTTRSRIASITECAGDNTCLPPTTFAWQNDMSLFAAPATDLPADNLPLKQLKNQWYDVDGDGKPDRCVINDEGVVPFGGGVRQYAIYCYYSSLGGQLAGTGPSLLLYTGFTAPYPQVPLLTQYDVSFGDINGDGKADVCQGSRCWLSTGTGFGPAFDAFGSATPSSGWALLDINGDARADLSKKWTTPSNPTATPTLPTKVGMTIYFSQGSTFDTSLSGSTLVDQVFTCYGNNCSLPFQWVDISGDGIPSLCQRDVGTADTDLASGVLRCRKWQRGGTFGPEVVSQTLMHLMPQKSTLHGYPAPTGFSSLWIDDASWVDFNGDGKKDFCTATVDAGSATNPNVILRCLLSTGTGFGDLIASPSMQLGPSIDFQWIDINGDGKTDFCGTVDLPAGKARKCILSTGTGFGNTTTTAAGTADSDIVDIDGNGLSALCYRTAKNEPASITRCQKSTGTVPDLLSTVTDGLGAVGSIAYQPLTSATVYSKGSGAVYPQQDIIDSRMVVSSVATSNGIGTGTNTTSYKYGAGRNDASGRDFRGFVTTEIASPNNLKTITTRDLIFPFGTTSSTETTVVKSGNTTLSETKLSFTASSPLSGANGTNYLVLPATTIAKTWDLNGAFVNHVETAFTNYDAYGNAQSIATTYKDVNGALDNFSESATITYSNDVTNWIFGLPLTRTVTRKAPGYADVTRTTNMTYFPSGLPQQVVVEPTDATQKLVTDFTYDAFGNLKTKDVSGAGITARNESTTTYDAKGRYPETITNALAHKETHGYDEKFGTRTSLKGPNDLTTSWTYDGFGRVRTETRPDATVITTEYKRCAGCVTDSAFFISRTNTVSGGASVSPPVNVYYDKLGREILTQTRGFSDAFVYTETFYDALGRVSKRLLPYYDSEVGTRSSSTLYDDLARPIEFTAPDGKKTTYAYNGRVSSVTNGKSQKKTTTTNSQGKTISVVDADGTSDSSSMAYEYEPFGNLAKTTDALGNVIKTEYSSLGRKKKLIDPDLGTWQYEYDGLGQLTKQTDAKGQAQSFTYDTLGRRKTRTATDLTSTWYYETDSAGATCSTGKGKLCEATASNGYSRKLSYDAVGRIASSTTVIDTASAATKYLASWAYDAAGRLSTTTYPASGGTPTFPQSFKVKYDYTGYGHLSKVSNAATSAAFWTANSKNADGNTSKETFGNGIVTNYAYDSLWGRLKSIQGSSTGNAPFAVQNQSYTFDTLGNLETRKDDAIGTSEAFAYDSLNRLTCANLTGSACTVGGAQTQSVSYDKIGNILTKTSNVAGYQIGTYNYNASGATSVRPHAVVSITGSINGINNPGYGYDSNGSLLNGGGRTVTWTTFNMVKTLANAGGTETFSYGAEQQRTKQTWPNDTAPTTTKVYLFDPHYEKVTTGSLIEHKHYITTGGGYGGRMIAVYTKRSDGTESTRYMHTDHLGSTSVVTNESGAVVERMAYDPWGDRRGATSASAADVTTTIIPTTTDRGFTGHEHLDMGGIGLVHMNGRIYDPTLGKFLSADPNVTNPYFSQSFNRYAYVWNNPLTLTDPSGYNPATVVTGTLPQMTITGTLTFEGRLEQLQQMRLREEAQASLMDFERPEINSNPGASLAKYFKELGQSLKNTVTKSLARQVDSNLTPIGTRLLGAYILSALGAPSESDQGAEGKNLDADEGAKKPEENRKPAPFLPDDPYSPEEVGRRQSGTRAQEGARSLDPDSPIPDRGPGKDMGGHEARGRTPHETGERNVNSNEEHSRRPKGNPIGTPRR